jgi:hypothetical protein
MAYAATFDFPQTIITAGGENSFDSIWKMINADGVGSNHKYDPSDASADQKKANLSSFVMLIFKIIINNDNTNDRVTLIPFVFVEITFVTDACFIFKKLWD